MFLFVADVVGLVGDETEPLFLIRSDPIPILLILSTRIGRACWLVLEWFTMLRC
jgi:hypothetical protein